MKKYVVVLSFLTMLSFIGCTDTVSLKKIEDVGLKVSFNAAKSSVNRQKVASAMTYQTPESYNVALKSVTLKGANSTNDVILFNSFNLASSLVFDFMDNTTVHSLLTNQTIPDGDYNGIELEIYYLQMNLPIATTQRGIERRNIRIYLSDDAENEGGLHQPGDMTQINDNVEIGWLLGEGQMPNMDPVTPRASAYTFAGNGTNWYDFAGKNAQNYGPFGDVEFMSNAPHPIYKTMVDFKFVDNNGTKLIIDFNVNNCWRFEDKSGDGAFGAADLDQNNPTKWEMVLPAMTITLQ